MGDLQTVTNALNQVTHYDQYDKNKASVTMPKKPTLWTKCTAQAGRRDNVYVPRAEPHGRTAWRL